MFPKVEVATLGLETNCCAAAFDARLRHSAHRVRATEETVLMWGSPSGAVRRELRCEPTREGLLKSVAPGLTLRRARRSREKERPESQHSRWLNACLLLLRLNLIHPMRGVRFGRVSP